ncbi:MAG: protein-disulfide reductase DsbD family protein, partial [Thermoanaerobaculia bacterium]|nr:protein-disulfide reductase DsbD family protein [Thermoanaerobaculia bacterium]
MPTRAPSRCTRSGLVSGLGTGVSAVGARPARRAAVALAIATALAALPAAAQLERQEKASMRVAADRTSYAAGSEASLVVEMVIEPRWHTNSHEPTYDYLIPTEVEVTVPEGWPEPSVAYPPGEMKSFAFAEEEISVYEGRVVMVATQPIPDDVEAGTATLGVALTYQACDDRRCLPPVTTRRELALAVGEEGEPTEAAAAIESAAPPGAVDGARVAEAPNLAWLLLLGFLGGVILNAMPCVLPVLSLKLFGLVKSAGEGRSAVVAGALATSAGILFSFLALAVAAVVAKAGGAAVGWGIQFQNPTFVAALTVVVLLFCLNLWGLFEIPLPGRLASAAQSTSRSASGGSLAGHFGSGLFATLMATPCSAPFLGTAIGFGLSQSASTIVAIFAAIGVGMATP